MTSKLLDGHFYIIKKSLIDYIVDNKKYVIYNCIITKETNVLTEFFKDLFQLNRTFCHMFAKNNSRRTVRRVIMNNNKSRQSSTI